MNLPPLHTGTGAIVTIIKLSNGGYHLMPNHKSKPIETNEPKDHTMDKNIQAYQSYQVTYKPPGARHELEYQTIRVKARDGHDAMRRAAWATGCQAWNPVRVD